MNERSVAIIPARGGSKGLPLKNLQLLGGRPLISWTIEAALTCSWVRRVIVSTDHPEIARVSRACGAEVPFLRPADLATDRAHLGDVMNHALAWLRDDEGADPSVVAHFSVTYPFRSRSFVDAAFNAVCDGTADVAVTARRRLIGPATFVRLEGDRIQPCLERNLAAWEPIGSLSVHAPRRGLTRWHFVPVTNPLHQIDIDDAEDLAQAERALRAEVA